MGEGEKGVGGGRGEGQTK